MVIIVRSLENPQVEAFQDQLITIYRDAFGLSPYCKEEAEVVDFAQSLPAHVEKEGFRIALAVSCMTRYYSRSHVPRPRYHPRQTQALSLKRIRYTCRYRS